MTALSIVAIIAAFAVGFVVGARWPFDDDDDVMEHHRNGGDL
jgi:hypothetical protein